MTLMFSLCSWLSFAASFLPLQRRKCRKAWWTTSACSSLSVAAPSAPPSLPSYTRHRLLKATSSLANAAGTGTRSNTLSDSTEPACFHSVISCAVCSTTNPSLTLKAETQKWAVDLLHRSCKDFLRFLFSLALLRFGVIPVINKGRLLCRGRGSVFNDFYWHLWYLLYCLPRDCTWVLSSR